MVNDSDSKVSERLAGVNDERAQSWKRKLSSRETEPIIIGNVDRFVRGGPGGPLSVYIQGRVFREYICVESWPADGTDQKYFFVEQ
jgi:hypothetical protein